MEVKKRSILVIEDDPALGFLISDFLGDKGFDVELTKNGDEGIKAFKKKSFDVIIVDVMMPVKDGFAVAKEVRETDDNTPLIFLTARNFKEDKLKGFEIGADDYITKPFDEEELLARVKALLRRQTSDSKKSVADQISIGLYTFEPGSQALTTPGGETRRLTEKETKVLNYLVKNANQLVKREDALKAVWGVNDYFLGRSLDVFITRLRKYLSEDPNVKIETVHGVGFLFKV